MNTWYRLDLYKHGKNKKFSSAWYTTKASAYAAKQAIISTPYSKRHLVQRELGGEQFIGLMEMGGLYAKGPFEDNGCNFAQ